MTTSKLSKEQKDNSISAHLDFHVRTSVSEDNKGASEKELGQDYFTSAYGYLGKFNLSLQSLKMLEIYSPLKKGKYSKKSSFKLPKQGMMLNGQLFQQEMWVGVTYVNVYGSLPTPTTRDWKDSGENMNYKKAAEKKRLAGVLNHTHSDLTGKDTTLSPAFLEEMMGFPKNWTQIGETEKKESNV